MDEAAASQARVCPPHEFESGRFIRTIRRLEECRGPYSNAVCSRPRRTPDLTKSDAKRALIALDEIVLQELGSAQKVRIGGLVQLHAPGRARAEERKGRNPATGEEITIAAKPVSVDLRARPLAKAKEALPSVQKALPAGRLSRLHVVDLSAFARRPFERRLAARWRLAARVDQEPDERAAVALWVKRIAAADQLANAFEVVEQPELAGRVVPLAGVVALDRCGQRGQRLDLDAVLPPSRWPGRIR
ncbi:MAG: HU family DNA-binding protein [Solirubrobacteraceae bacterium]